MKCACTLLLVDNRFKLLDVCCYACYSYILSSSPSKKDESNKSEFTLGKTPVFPLIHQHKVHKLALAVADQVSVYIQTPSDTRIFLKFSSPNANYFSPCSTIAVSWFTRGYSRHTHNYTQLKLLIQCQVHFAIDTRSFCVAAWCIFLVTFRLFIRFFLVQADDTAHSSLSLAYFCIKGWFSARGKTDTNSHHRRFKSST